jgi:hypothetical protein
MKTLPRENFHAPRLFVGVSSRSDAEVFGSQKTRGKFKILCLKIAFEIILNDCQPRIRGFVCQSKNLSSTSAVIAKKIEFYPRELEQWREEENRYCDGKFLSSVLFSRW